MMYDLILQRVWSDEDGTRGVLIVDFPRFVTLEPVLPIPAGEYSIERQMSPKFKRELFELIDVPGHTEVKFHKGNVVKDTKLCILLGKSFGVINGVPGIQYSEDALDLFMMLMAGTLRAKLVVKGW